MNLLSSLGHVARTVRGMGKTSLLAAVLSVTMFLAPSAVLAQVYSVPQETRSVSLEAQGLLELLQGYGSRSVGELTIVGSSGESQAIAMEPVSLAEGPSVVQEVTPTGSRPLSVEIYHFKSSPDSPARARVSVYRRDPDGMIVVTGSFSEGFELLGFESAPVAPSSLGTSVSVVSAVASPIDLSDFDETVPACRMEAPTPSARPSMTAVQTGIPGQGGYGDRSLLYRNVQAMLDADWEYVQLLGSASNAAAVIQATINSVNGIFENQLDLHLAISSLTIWNTPNDPFDSSQPPADELDALLATRSRIAVGYDVAQLFTGRDLMAGSAVGLGRILGACRVDAMSVVRHSTNPANRTSLTAHEIGHLLGAGHDSQGIMIGVINAATSFSAQSISEMLLTNWCFQPVTDDSPIPGGIPEIRYQMNGSLAQFQWNPPASGPVVTGYEVFKSTSETSCAGSVYAQVGNEFFDDASSLTLGNFYQYSLRAMSAGGYGPCTPLDVPAPILSIASITEPNPTQYDSVTLAVGLEASSPPVPQFTALQVFRSLSETACSGAPISTVALPFGANGLTFDAPLSEYGRPQYFSVRAITLGNVGPCSAPRALARTSAPSSVAASQGAFSDRVEISWNSSFPLARMYFVYRFEVGRPETQVTLGSSFPATTFIDTTAASDGRRYNYYVQACNASGCASSGFALGYRDTLPPAPQGVQASDGTSPTGITVTWNPVEFGRVINYRVFRSVTGTQGPYVLAAEVSGAFTSYTDTNSDIRFGYPVAYKVSAVTAVGEGPQSGFDNGFVQVSVPALLSISSVTEPVVVPQPPSVTVSWSNTAGTPSFFDVYRSTTAAGCTGTRVLRTSLQQTSYALSFEIPQYGVPYYFSVQGLNGAGVGPCSSAVAVALPAATTLTAGQGSSATSVALSWSTNPLVRQFRVERRVLGGAGAFSEIYSVGRTEVSFADSTAAADGTRYEYRVLGCNVSGCTPSQIATGWRAAAPSAPRALTATDRTVPGAIDIAWSSPERGNVDSYRIEIALQAAGPFSSLSSQPSSSSSLRISTAEHTRYGEDRFFRVIAVSALGESSPSNVDVGAALVQIPGAPTNVVVREAAPSLSVTWSAPQGASGRYSVFRALSQTSACVGTPLATGLTGTLYTDSSAVYGTQYFYSVLSTNAAGSGPCSVVSFLAVPGAVVTEASNPGSSSGVSLFANGAAGQGRYSFRRSDTGQSGTFVEIANLSSPIFTDVSAPADGTPVWYSIVACNASGCGSGSVAQGRRSAAPLPALSVSASDGTVLGRVRVTWAANPRGYVQRYLVQRSVSASGPFAELGVVMPGAALEFDDTTAAPQVSYYYRVVSVGDLSPNAVSAVDAGFSGGNSSSSSSISSSVSSSSSSSVSSSSVRSSASSSVSSSSSSSASSLSSSSQSSSQSSSSTSSSSLSSSSVSSSASSSSSSSSSVSSSSSSQSSSSASSSSSVQSSSSAPSGSSDSSASSSGSSASTSSSASSSSSLGVDILGQGTPRIPGGARVGMTLRLTRAGTNSVRVRIVTTARSRTGDVLTVAPQANCQFEYFLRRKGRATAQSSLGAVNVIAGSVTKTRTIAVRGSVAPARRVSQPDTIVPGIRCGDESLLGNAVKLSVPRALASKIRASKIPGLVRQTLR